jgi:hypothetical protein
MGFLELAPSATEKREAARKPGVAVDLRFPDGP